MGEAWLEAYDGQTTEELLALEGRYRIDSLVVAFDQAIQQKAGPLTREERYIVAVEALEREVNNGGYDQLFGNTGAEFLDVIEEALRAIGCPETAAITHDAIAAVGLPAPIGDADLRRRLEKGDEALGAALGGCDARYYAMSENIAEQLFRWIGRNKSLIRLGA